MVDTKMQGKPTDSRLEGMRKIFATRLRRRMHELEMSQSDLARAIWKEERVDSRGYPQPLNKDRVSAWVLGRVLPTQENMQKLAEALGVASESLLPELEELKELGVAPTPSQQRTFAERPDLSFRMVDGGVYAEIRCKISVAGWRELMTVLAKHIQEYENLREIYGLSGPDESGEASSCAYVPVRVP